MGGNLNRPSGFGRNGTVFGVAPPHNVKALARRRSPKSGTVALRNLVTLSLAGTTRSLRGRRDRCEKAENRGQIFSSRRVVDKNGVSALFQKARPPAGALKYLII